jgi:hypothetical protein
MPDSLITLALLTLILAAVVLPSAADNDIGQWISSSTRVSGQATVNETITLKTLTYDGGLPVKQEWKFQENRFASSGSAWGSSLWLGHTGNGAAMKYQWTGVSIPLSLRI